MSLKLKELNKVRGINNDRNSIKEHILMTPKEKIVRTVCPICSYHMIDIKAG